MVSWISVAGALGEKMTGSGWVSASQAKGILGGQAGGKAEKRKRGLTQRRKDAETQRNGLGKYVATGRGEGVATGRRSAPSQPLEGRSATGGGMQVGVWLENSAGDRNFEVVATGCRHPDGRSLRDGGSGDRHTAG